MVWYCAFVTVRTDGWRRNGNLSRALHYSILAYYVTSSLTEINQGSLPYPNLRIHVRTPESVSTALTDAYSCKYNKRGHTFVHSTFRDICLTFMELKHRNGIAAFSLPLQFRVRVVLSAFWQLPQSSSFVRTS